MASPIGRRSQMRADLGEENRDPEADGNGDHHRDPGGDQRAVDRAERAQHRRIGRRRPALRPQEGEAVFPDRGPGADDQGKDDAAEDEENRDRAGARDPVEGDIAELERAESPRAIIRSGSIHYVAFDRHFRHANPLYLYLIRLIRRVPRMRTARSGRASRDSEMHCQAEARSRRQTRSCDAGSRLAAQRRALTRPDMRPQLLMSADQVFSISLTTGSGIGM